MAGVSIDALGAKRFKLRWREAQQGADGAPLKKGNRTVWRARSETVSSKEAAIELRAAILRALETTGTWVAPSRAEEPEIVVASLEDALLAWMRHKKARNAAAGTLSTYRSYIVRWARTIRGLHAIADNAPIPVTVLSRTLFTDALHAWGIEGLSDTRKYDCSRVLYEAWKWIADEGAQFPGTPRPPLSASSILPAAPVRGEAPDEPTVAEMDAVTRRMAEADRISGLVALTMRATGLRVSQVLGIRASDIDIAEATLRVRVGKSRQEKADQRLIVLPDWLVDSLREQVERCAPEGALFPTRKGRETSQARAAWEAATEAGEVRRDVWDPPNRNKTRPNHAYRAGAMKVMELAQVPDRVIDHLVGHHPSSTRARSYTKPTLGELRTFVARTPAPAIVATGDDAPSEGRAPIRVGVGKARQKLKLVK